mgnify:CR=1 FL=1
MRFAVFHLIMALWVLWRLVLPLDLPRLFKAALALLVVVTASFSTVTVFFFGGLLSPEAPRWFLIAGNSGEAVLLFLLSEMKGIFPFRLLSVQFLFQFVFHYPPHHNRLNRRFPYFP